VFQGWTVGVRRSRIFRGKRKGNRGEVKRVENVRQVKRRRGGKRGKCWEGDALVIETDKYRGRKCRFRNSGQEKIR